MKDILKMVFRFLIGLLLCVLILAVFVLIYGGLIWIAVTMASFFEGIGKVFVAGFFGLLLIRMVVHHAEVFSDAIKKR